MNILQMTSSFQNRYLNIFYYDKRFYGNYKYIEQMLDMDSEAVTYVIEFRYHSFVSKIFLTLHFLGTRRSSLMPIGRNTTNYSLFYSFAVSRIYWHTDGSHSQKRMIPCEHGIVKRKKFSVGAATPENGVLPYRSVCAFGKN